MIDHRLRLGVGVRNGSTIRQCQLARMLRQLREEAGPSLEEAAPKLDWSTSKLGRIESRARAGGSPTGRS